LEAVLVAGIAGCWLVQHLAVSGTSYIVAAQRDAGGSQHAGLDDADRAPVLRLVDFAPADHRRGAVDLRRAAGAESRRMACTDVDAAGAGRSADDPRRHHLVVLQLVADAATRSAGYTA